MLVFESNQQIYVSYCNKTIGLSHDKQNLKLCTLFRKPATPYKSFHKKNGTIFFIARCLSAI